MTSSTTTSRSLTRGRKSSAPIGGREGPTGYDVSPIAIYAGSASSWEMWCDPEARERFMSVVKTAPPQPFVSKFADRLVQPVYGARPAEWILIVPDVNAEVKAGQRAGGYHRHHLVDP